MAPRLVPLVLSSHWNDPAMISLASFFFWKMVDRDRKGNVSMQQSTRLTNHDWIFESFETNNYGIIYIWILNLTFSRVLNPLKSVDSTDSLHIIEKTVDLYPPSYVYLWVSRRGLENLGGGEQDTMKYGIYLVWVWISVTDSTFYQQQQTYIEYVEGAQMGFACMPRANVFFFSCCLACIYLLIQHWLHV